MTISPIRLLLLAVLTFVIGALAINLLLQRLDTAQLERDLALDEVKGLREAARITGERLATAAANDAKHTQELSDALKSNGLLRQSVGAGDQRLFVKADCPAPDVRPHTGASGLADAGAAELAADARPDYFTLRDQLALSKQMILGLQDHVRSFCTTQLTTTGARP